MPLPSELGLPIPDGDEENPMIYQPQLCMDLAKSSAAACRTCKAKFTKGDPRMGMIFNAYSDQHNRFYDSTTTWYYHVKCGCDQYKAFFAVSEVHGLNAMPKKEQDMVKKAFPKSMPKNNEAQVKGKVQAEPKAIAKRPAAAEASDEKAPAKKAAKVSGSTAKVGSIPAVSGLNASDFESKKEEVSGWTNDKLKKLLKANDQSQTGNKAVLVAKCAFGLAYGKLPRCQKCYGGKIKFRLNGENGELASLSTLHGGASGRDEAEDEVTDKKVYYCTGYFDDDDFVSNTQCCTCGGGLRSQCFD